MPSGTIARLLIDKGFGFIRDESGVEHFFHRSGREPVSRDIDYIVGARHNEDVTVFINEAGITRLVVSRKL